MRRAGVWGVRWRLCVFVFAPCRYCEAMATWQWWNYLCSRVPANREPLCVNMDETSICLFQGGGKGTVFKFKKRGRPVQNVPKSRKRQCLTYAAFVCDRSDVQPCLPQVIIGNEATFPAAAFTALKAAAPPNIRLIRQKSAWNNSILCSEMIAWLAEALLPWRHRYQPILFLDAHRLHTAREVLVACNREMIWPALIPALLTWLLQPLDVNGFFSFKALLKKSYQEARASFGASDLSIHQFLNCLYITIRRVIQGTKWAAVFDRVGLGQFQHAVSERVKGELQVTGQIQAGVSRPPLQQLQRCFPSNAVVPEALLWRCVERTLLQAISGNVPSAGAAARVSAALPALCLPDESIVRAEGVVDESRMDLVSMAPRSRRVLPSSFETHARRFARRRDGHCG